ncbi:MAG TPA: aspartate aminotransferase family protein, partial [Verrucomicrobiae bacterium]|nr:aspartate aminotransferase family protein [Verrucomicrobiae bacterium]
IFCNSGFEAVEAALKTAMLTTGRRGIIAFAGAYHGLGYGALNATHRGHFRAPFRSQLGEFGYFVPFPRSRGNPYVSLPSRRLKAVPIPAEANDDDEKLQTRSSSLPLLGPRTESRRKTESTWAGVRASQSQHAGPIIEDNQRPGEARETLRGLESQIRSVLQREKIGAILVEPIQLRGGVNVPPAGFLPLLRRLCNEHDALLILDEIYTGFGRTGKWFACEHSGTVPDIVCLGKALTGGFPLSACVGRADLMDGAWPPSAGEAIHTSTFLGHPVGCAMALAQIKEIARLKLVQRSAKFGSTLCETLVRLAARKSGLTLLARGAGLLAGLELRHPDGSPATNTAIRIVKNMLHRGFILLPEGEHSNVISFTPPLTVTEQQLRQTVHALAEELEQGLPA